MNKTKTILLLTALLLASTAAAEINFRSDQPIDFYNNLRLQNSDLNMNNNEIQQFFDNACPDGEAITNIDPDGTFECAVAAGAPGLPLVMENNNTANQTLDMNGNLIKNLGAPVDSNDAVRLQDLAGLVNRSGDTMAGNLYFNNYDIINPGQIKTGGTGGDTITIRDTNNSQDIARFNEGGNVEIPNGYLQFGSGNNEIQGIEVIRAGGSVASLHTGGSGSGMWRVYDTANSNNIAEFKEGGNVEIPNGDLKMAGNNVNLQGGSVTTDTGEVCIGDECS